MSKIETIFEHGGGELGIDDSNNLYWNKRLIITRGKIALDWWVNFSIIIASLSTLVMAIYAVLDYHCK